MATETYQLAIEGIAGTSYNQVIMHFTGVGVSSGDTLAAGESLNLGFDASLRALWLATLPPDYLLTMLASRRVSAVPSATAVESEVAGGYAGTLGTQCTALQTCPSVFLVPTMGTKSGGKIFWPCIPQGQLIDSVYQAAWKTAVDAFIAAAVAGFTQAGITWTLAIWSRKTQSASTVAGHNFSPVIGFQGKRRKPAGAVS